MRVKKQLTPFAMACLMIFAFSGCRSNDYFDDGHDERRERKEDRRDRRAMEKEKYGEGLNFMEKTEDFFEKSSRRMDKNEWGNF